MWYLAISKAFDFGRNFLLLFMQFLIILGMMYEIPIFCNDQESSTVKLSNS